LKKKMLRGFIRPIESVVRLSGARFAYRHFAGSTGKAGAASQQQEFFKPIKIFDRYTTVILIPLDMAAAKNVPAQPGPQKTQTESEPAKGEPVEGYESGMKFNGHIFQEFSLLYLFHDHGTNVKHARWLHGPLRAGCNG
jgi:hypothetical protein